MDEKILIVEDDEAIANILKEHLKKEGYTVNWASTGKEGLNDFKLQKFDLAILDVMMPEMDGFTLCKNIRMVNEDIPVIFISAKQEEKDKINGLNLGGDDYITKPFSLAEVSARVSAQLRRYRRNGKIISQKQMEFKNGLSIRTEEKQVTIYEKEIPLTGKEFELLSLMAQNSGKVFSKSELYQHIWQSEDIEGNNTITVHIKGIREKLNDSSKNPRFIQTVWGTGYKFIGEKI